MQPGDTIEFRLKFENVGETTVGSVYAFDTLELGQGMEYIKGTTRISRDGGTQTLAEDGLFESGISLGKFEAGQKAEIYYQVKISEQEEKFSCGETVLYNGAAVSFGAEEWKGSESGEGSGEGNGAGMATQYDKVRVTVVRNSCIPEELPTTGPAEIILAVIVVLGIGAGVAYYISSRNAVKKIEKDIIKKA